MSATLKKRSTKSASASATVVWNRIQTRVQAKLDQLTARTSLPNLRTLMGPSLSSLPSKKIIKERLTEAVMAAPPFAVEYAKKLRDGISDFVDKVFAVKSQSLQQAQIAYLRSECTASIMNKEVTGAEILKLRELLETETIAIGLAMIESSAQVFETMDALPGIILTILSIPLGETEEEGTVKDMLTEYWNDAKTGATSELVIKVSKRKRKFSKS